MRKVSSHFTPFKWWFLFLYKYFLYTGVAHSSEPMLSLGGGGGGAASSAAPPPADEDRLKYTLNIPGAVAGSEIAVVRIEPSTYTLANTHITVTHTCSLRVLWQVARLQW